MKNLASRAQFQFVLHIDRGICCGVYHASYFVQLGFMKDRQEQNRSPHFNSIRERRSIDSHNDLTIIFSSALALLASLGSETAHRTSNATSGDHGITRRARHRQLSYPTNNEHSYSVDRRMSQYTPGLIPHGVVKNGHSYSVDRETK
jgi:hypothetical protein